MEFEMFKQQELLFMDVNGPVQNPSTSPATMLSPNTNTVIPNMNCFHSNEVIAIDARSKLDHRHYHNDCSYALDPLNHAKDEKHYRNHLRSIMKEIQRVPLPKKSFAKAVIFTSNAINRDILALRESRYQDFFKSYGWKDCQIVALKELPTATMFAHTECVIMDSDLKIQVRSSLSLRSLTHAASHSVKSFSCNALDLAHFLHGKGYQGLTVFAHRHGLLPTDTNLLNSETSSMCELNFNPYVHTVRIDHHIVSPFHVDDVKVITRLCEERRMRMLLNL
jgi:hypothetical protein